MATYTGYLLIADISGYTAYLTASEQEHANPILRSLLTSLVEQINEPLHLWRMDGDAILAYSTAEEFPSGEAFLAICENLYNAFTTLRRDIIANTTCPCQACANIDNLDLKIMAHHGCFEENAGGAYEGYLGRPTSSSSTKWPRPTSRRSPASAATLYSAKVLWMRWGSTPRSLLFPSPSIISEMCRCRSTIWQRPRRASEPDRSVALSPRRRVSTPITDPSRSQSRWCGRRSLTPNSSECGWACVR